MRKLLILLAPIGWFLKGFALLLMKFKVSENIGKEIISGGELGKASRLMRSKDYEKAYWQYRKIIDRGGQTTSEAIASERIAWFYENGIGVEKNIEFAEEMKTRAKVIIGE